MKREAASSTLDLGEKAPYFSLPATDGKIYSLSDFVGVNALALVFTCNHCPYARAYEGRICTIAERYHEQGARLVAICSNDSDGYPEDRFERMVEKSQSLGFKFPYLHDHSQIAARAYDAACTPEVFLFDRDHRLAYHGAIDDSWEDPSKVTQPYLENAIEALLEGRRPDPALTPVLGCSIKWRA